MAHIQNKTGGQIKRIHPRLVTTCSVPFLPVANLGQKPADFISSDVFNVLHLGSDGKLLVEPQKQELPNHAIRTDIFQNLTSDEQKQACQNIGIIDPNIDFVAIYNTAKGA